MTPGPAFSRAATPGEKKSTRSPVRIESALPVWAHETQEPGRTCEDENTGPDDGCRQGERHAVVAPAWGSIRARKTTGGWMRKQTGSLAAMWKTQPRLAAHLLYREARGLSRPGPGEAKQVREGGLDRKRKRRQSRAP